MQEVSTMTLEEIVDSGQKLTPMMTQYHEIKKNYPDTILFFRMGDFYEVFFQDAHKTAKLLNIAITHRGKLGDHSIPMAGIPHHAATTYIDKLTEQGQKVAICDQLEDPKDAKGIVKRGITQIVGPSVPYDLDKTTPNEQKFMCSVFEFRQQLNICLLDFTTGEFVGLESLNELELIEQLQRFMPKEMICYMGQWEKYPQIQKFLDLSDILITYLSLDYFSIEQTSNYLNKLLPNYTTDRHLSQNPGLLASTGALSYYVISTQGQDNLSHIRQLRLEANESRMNVTIHTLKGLEILPRSKETYKESLLGMFDKTMSAMGARRLKNIFISPTRDLKTIKATQKSIAFYLEHHQLLESTRTSLSDLRDVERLLAKVSTHKSNSSDLLNLSKSVFIYENISSELSEAPFEKMLSGEQTTVLRNAADLITKAINDELGACVEKGNLIKEGYCPERDKLAQMALKKTKVIEDLEQQYKEQTGISNLKIKSNNVAGYFIEVSKSHITKVPAHFLRKQTLTNAERYSTQELIEYENQILLASSHLAKLERQIFQEITEQVISCHDLFVELGKFLAELDVLQSLSWVAWQEDFICPELVEDQSIIKLKQVWHPLIRSTLQGQFVCHDLVLDQSNYFALITGPNMAGKTTVMREVAIVQFLAQIGSFVPAQEATLGLCDYLFSRLGAHDDILRGQSTFMVEMSETAEIVRHATHQSLILLDEVGRGTSTYDGMSIAWALVEHLVKETKALCLFATHYHELIELIYELEGAKNLTVQTRNEAGKVEFLYHLIEEAASQSFGLYVAKLAGLPPKILRRGQSILKQLEKRNGTHALPSVQEQLTFFEVPPYEENQLQQDMDFHQTIINEIKALNTSSITPIEALTKIHQWQNQMLTSKTDHKNR